MASKLNRYGYSAIGLILIFFLFSMVIGFFVEGCTPKTVPPQVLKPPDNALYRLAESAYPQFTDDGDLDPLLRSISMSLAYLKRLPSDRSINFGADPYTVSQLILSLETFARIIKEKPSWQQLNQIIRKKFYVYQSAGRKNQNDVLFTGYYEPLLMASLTQSSEFNTPVHSKPADMVEIDLSRFSTDLQGHAIIGQYTGKTIIPYPTRGEIGKKADFNAIAPPLVWLRDEIDHLILQIQGSGRVKLTDGSQQHILYAGSNGQPYKSIGRLLIDEGRIPAEKMSMQAIRNYLKKHPKESQRIMNHNPRYIFFKRGKKGPMGALGQPLTPMRSIAVDRSIMPSAALAFIQTPLPKIGANGKIKQWEPYQGFALAQDAGSAIKGPGRVDLYMGFGPKAEMGAGHLKHSGALYFLVLKPSHSANMMRRRSPR